MLKLVLQNIISLFAPNFIKKSLLNFFGHDIHRNAKIGMVLLGKEIVLKLDSDTHIHSFNFLSCFDLYLRRGSKINCFNLFSGAFSADLGEGASIGRVNRFKNSGMRLEAKNCSFSIGKGSNITSFHYLDLTDSILIGENSVVGGSHSQFWTHGFRHFDKGMVRLRVDGEIKIGDGVYIGSRVLLNPGVAVGDCVSVGAGAVVSKDLLVSGMYVSERLRMIELDDENFYSKYKATEETEITYFKKR